MSISVLLVDDHPMFRKGLRVLIEEEPDMSVVGEAGDGKEAIEEVRKLSPNVVVMDITMPSLNGIEATRQIRSNSPDTKVVALSIHDSTRFIKEMLTAGAKGYLLKDCVPEELVDGIRKIVRNETYLSSTITKVVVSELLEDSIDEHAIELPDERTTDYSDITLFTKIGRPAPYRDHVHRQHLLDRLDQGLPCGLILVVAPAGYGKTTLVNCWLEAANRPSAWVSLDKSDNDLRLFLNYLIDAVQTISPDACLKTRAMINAVMLPPVSTLAMNLANELDQMEQSFILVLDDFHRINDDSVLDLFIQLIRARPEPCTWC